MNVVNIHVQYSGPCTLTVRSLYICHLCIFILDVMHSLEHVPWSILWCHQNQLETPKFDSISHASVPNVQLLFVSMLATFVKTPTDWIHYFSFQLEVVLLIQLLSLWWWWWWCWWCCWWLEEVVLLLVVLIIIKRRKGRVRYTHRILRINSLIIVNLLLSDHLYITEWTHMQRLLAILAQWLHMTWDFQLHFVTTMSFWR